MTKNCALSVVVKNLQKASIKPVNQVEDLKNIQSPVLRDSGRKRQKFINKVEELLKENGTEKTSLDNKRQMKN